MLLPPPLLLLLLLVVPKDMNKRKMDREMTAMRWLGLPKRGERARAHVWRQVPHPNPLGHAVTPNADQPRLCFARPNQKIAPGNVGPAVAVIRTFNLAQIAVQPSAIVQMRA